MRSGYPFGVRPVETAMNNQTPRAFWTDRPKLIAAISLALLLGSIGMQVHSSRDRAELEASINGQRSAYDKLQAEREQGALRSVELERQLKLSEGNVAEQEDQRVLAEQKAFALEQRIAQLNSTEASAAKWRKEAENMTAERARLQQQLAEAEASVNRLNSEKFAMEQQTASLRAEMERMANDQAAVDNSLTQAFRGKHEKLTVLAKRTRKLQLSMVLPPSVAKQASYIITTPDGQIIKGDDPSVSVITNSQPGAMVASGGKGATPGADQVKLVYIPKKKLKPGMYKIQVKAGERALGSTFIALR